jgi:uncharacterized protein (TIGR03032 family)
MTPFSATYSPQIPELLILLQCSIALTTYQAGKLVLISPNQNKESLITLPRSFHKPMGMAIEGNNLAIASKDEVILLENSPELAQHYPGNPNTYDTLWLPRVTFYTGQVDMHDIAFGHDGIYAVNTSFSCICKVDGNYNFKPIWQPHFIDSLVSEDRCHLNGMVMINGKPKYVTALGSGNSMQSWRADIVAGGVLMDIEQNEILLQGLSMPHSPKWYNNELYFLQSANGTLSRFDFSKQQAIPLKKFDGFCRGLSIHQDYAFIGFSKLRKNSSTFAKLSFSDQANFAGIKIIHLPTLAEVGEIRYQTSVDEIYEVMVLPNTLRPNVLNTMNEVHKQALAIPGATFWAQSSVE